MRYQMFDVEVTDPITDLALSPEDTGAAILIRRKGVPIGFWMQRSNGAASITAEELQRTIVSEAGDRIVAAAIHEEIACSASVPPLPLITIAICSKDRPRGVERLLHSLRGQESRLPEGSAGLEILVVDNAPSDERTREIAEKFVPEKKTEFRYIRELKPGLNFGRNRALREARGEFLSFLDDDVVVDRYWLAGLVAAWSDNRDAAAFTGQVLPMEMETEAQILFEERGGFRRGFERIRYGAVLPGNATYPGGAGIFGAGANMTFRTDVARFLGGFDEALDSGAPVPGGGDLDMFYRIIRGGYALIYEPRFLVFHQHRRELAGLYNQYKRSWGLGFMCFLSKCIKTDPELRPALKRLLLWWLLEHTMSIARQSKRKLQRRPYFPPSIYLGELWHGAIGFMGGYERSQRHIEAIRKQFS
jgi:glycosyltransferase involved in cell wall biosynthesis